MRNSIIVLYGFPISFNTSGNTQELWNREGLQEKRLSENKVNATSVFLFWTSSNWHKRVKNCVAKEIKSAVPLFPVLSDFDSGIFILFLSLFLTVPCSVLSFSNYSTDAKKFMGGSTQSRLSGKDAEMEEELHMQ